MGYVLERRTCRAGKCENSFRVFPTSQHWYCCRWHHPDWNGFETGDERDRKEREIRAKEKMIERIRVLSLEGCKAAEMLARLNFEGFRRLSGKNRNKRLTAAYINSLRYRHGIFISDRHSARRQKLK